MRRKGIAWAVVVGLAMLCVGLAVAWWPTAFAAKADLPFQSPKSAVHPARPDLRLLSWNLHGLMRLRGTSTSPTSVTAEQVSQSLKDVAEAVKRIGPDILFLQGVDIDAARSGHVDQAAALAKALPAFAHVACAPLVAAPGPFGVGVSGLCVFSKYRLIRHTRELSTAAASFVAVDGAQRIEVAIGERRVTLVNAAFHSASEQMTEEEAAFLAQVARKTSEASPASAASEKDAAPQVLAVAVARQPTVPLSGWGPMTDVIVDLPSDRRATWPAASPSARRSTIALRENTPLVDMRVASEAGVSAAELPVVVNLLFTKQPQPSTGP